MTYGLAGMLKFISSDTSNSTADTIANCQAIAGRIDDNVDL